MAGNFLVWIWEYSLPQGKNRLSGSATLWLTRNDCFCSWGSQNWSCCFCKRCHKLQLRTREKTRVYQSVEEIRAMLLDYPVICSCHGSKCSTESVEMLNTLTIRLLSCPSPLRSFLSQKSNGWILQFQEPTLCREWGSLGLVFLISRFNVSKLCKQIRLWPLCSPLKAG